MGEVRILAPRGANGMGNEGTEFFLGGVSSDFFYGVDGEIKDS